MRAIFLADAHLRQVQDQNYQKLLDFLDQQQDLDALFLLGDIFEFWLGYKYLAFTAYIPLLEKLRQLKESGTKLYFVEGNHDFHMGAYFTDTLQCTVIPDQQQVEWDNRKLLLCHGDLLNPNPNYHRLRRLWRSGLIRFLSKLVHPNWVWSLGIWLSDLSQKKRPRSKNCNWDPSPLILPFAEEQIAAGADVVFCGHFHQPIDRQLAPGKQLIVIGDWIHQFSYAEMIDGQVSLKTFSS